MIYNSTNINQNTAIAHLKLLNSIKTTTYGIGIWSNGLGQNEKSGRAT